MVGDKEGGRKCLICYRSRGVDFRVFFNSFIGFSILSLVISCTRRYVGAMREKIVGSVAMKTVSLSHGA